MSASSSVNIAELIDRCPLGRMQIRIIVLCGLVALLEGFDVLAIGVAAPAMWQLFSASRAGGTVLLWASYFVTFMTLVCSSAWVPTLLQRAGTNGAQSSFAMALFALGSVFGTSVAGFVVSRFAGVLPAAPVGSAVTLAGVGYVSQSIVLAIMLLGLAGFFLGVASSGSIALAPLLYSTASRSTGVGWAMGVGRLGSFIGPLVIGLLVSRGWRVGDSFSAIAAPALCAALFTSLIRIGPHQQTLRVPLMMKAGTNGGESLHHTELRED